MPRSAPSSRGRRRLLCSCAVPLLALLGISVLLLMLLSSPNLNEDEIPTTDGGDSDEDDQLSKLFLRFVLKNQTAFVNQTSKGVGESGEQWMEALSWEPRAFVYHNFLSKEECEHLIKLAKPRMQKSLVIDSSSGHTKESRIRTSSGMFLRRGQDEIIRAIEKRIADFTFIPVENGEGLQVLHYEVGQKYEPHYDYFIDRTHKKRNQRTATVLMYLSDVEEGGETVFPRANVNSTSLPWYNKLSECGKKGLALKPKKGDALLFWSTKPDATLDVSSLHGGCPVIKGNKWSCTKWLQVSASI